MWWRLSRRSSPLAAGKADGRQAARDDGPATREYSGRELSVSNGLRPIFRANVTPKPGPLHRPRPEERRLWRRVSTDKSRARRASFETQASQAPQDEGGVRRPPWELRANAGLGEGRAARVWTIRRRAISACVLNVCRHLRRLFGPEFVAGASDASDRPRSRPAPEFSRPTIFSGRELNVSNGLRRFFRATNSKPAVRRHAGSDGGRSHADERRAATVRPARRDKA